MKIMSASDPEQNKTRQHDFGPFVTAKKRAGRGSWPPRPLFLRTS